MKEKQLEDALHAWPLEEVPAGFSNGVMNQIRTRQVWAQIPREYKVKFRLTWMDFALALFLSFLPVLAFVTYILLPRKFILFVQYQWLVLQFPPYQPVLLFTLLGGVAVLLLLTFVLSMRFLFPRQLSLF
jgi:hypothetical protein